MFKRRLTLISFLVIIFAVFPGCNKASKTYEITVWTPMTEMAVLNNIAEDFKKEYKIAVKIMRVPFEELQPKFQVAAPVGQGPELITGPHDWIGPFATAKLIAPIDVTREKLKQFIPVGLKAMSYGGKLYGLPLSLEAIGLIYNKKLVPRAPETLEELIKIAQELNRGDQNGFLFDINDFYFAWPFFGGYGAYIFKETKNGLDPLDIGLDNAGAIKAAQLILDFQEKYKLIPRGTNKDIASGRFIAGKLAMTINGPWALVDYKKTGIDYAVARIPKLENGKYPTPLVGVFGVMLNSKAKNKVAAVKFMNFLCNRKNQVAIYLAGGRIPSRFDAQADPEVIKNPDIRAIGECANAGTPMPNIPALSQVWQPMAEALQLITTKKQKPEEALAGASKRIKKNIERMME